MTYDPYRQPPHQAPTSQLYPAQGQYGHIPPDPAPPKRPSRWPYVALAAAMLVLAGGVWTVYDRGLILKDPGIKACEALRDGKSSIKGSDRANEKITKAQYLQMREVFEDSRHDDIRDHGTKLMDVVWQMSQSMGDSGQDAASGEALGAALAYMQPLMTHMTGLQSACADQGIIVNLKSGN